MDKELKKAAKYLLSKIESTEKFVIEQAPAICKDFVEEKLLSEKMDIYMSGGSAVILIGISISFGLLALGVPREQGDIGGRAFAYTLICLATGVPSFFMVHFFLSSVAQYLSVKRYPKVFLINKIRAML